MKKKLIAAVTSLAMVATMVPATAFAATATPADADQPAQVETKATDSREAETALSDAAKAFIAAVNKLEDANKIKTYDRLTDIDIATLCDRYAALSGAEVSVLQADTNEGGKAAYDKFVSLVKNQWNLRLEVIEDAVDAVDPVTVETGDTTTIKAVDDLAEFYTRFFENDNMYVVLGADPLQGGAPALNDEKLKENVDQVKATAQIANTDAQAVKDIVLDISKLPNVNSSNYSTVNASIQTINTAYEKLTDTQKKKVGNHSELTEKEKAVKAYGTEAKDVDDLIAKIAPELGGSAGAEVLTSKEIAAYTKAYNDANKAYNALSSAQKGNVTKKKDLDTARNNIANYAKGVTKEDAVTNMLSALPAGTNATDALSIAEAVTAYNALSDNATAGLITAGLEKGFQKNINTDLANRLTKAEAFIQTTLKKGGAADEDAIAEAAKPVADMIAALPKTITASDAEKVEAARSAYDAITTAFDSIINTAMKTELKTSEKTLKAAEKVIDGIEADNKIEVQKFIDAVAEIEKAAGGPIDENNAVNAKYRNATNAARAAYEALTTDQKSLVAANKPDGAKAAYNSLQIAEKNIASAGKLDEVAALIKAVPDAAKLDVTDTAAVQKVKDAQAAYEALTDGAKEQLTKDGYITSAQLKNYEDAVKKVTTAENKTASAAVTEAIKALPKLPTAFTSQSEIEAANAALVQTEAAYKALTKEQQAAVKNAGDLTNYRAKYNVLLKKYVDPLYAEVAKIDVTKELTAEDMAKIKELKAYIDGNYIETKNITGFDQKVYDALVEALDKAQKNEKALENATIAPIADQAYTGKAIEPAVTVTDKTGAVVDAKEYTVIYSNNVNVGEAKVVVAANSGSAYTGTASATFQIIRTTTSIASATVGDIADKTYTGSAIKPAVSVKLGNDTLKAGTDYTVAYKNNTKLGKATVTITGTGNYTGTITKSFIIKPAKESITSVKGGKGKITVAYKTQNKAKYRIITKKSGTKAKGTNTLATSKTVKNLKKGSYQVKVRAYKVIDGKTYYGAYSAVKTVKVK